MQANGLQESHLEVRTFRVGWLGETSESYWLTRSIFLRALGFINFIAFGSLAQQLRGLIGERGILPAARYLDGVKLGLGIPGFLKAPTLFWFNAEDGVLLVAAWGGALLGVAAVAGFGNSLVFGALWLLYLSFVHVGQIFYGYGWEMLLLETGFLAIFFAAPWKPRDSSDLPPVSVVVLLRWVLFRLMFGAGLIKIRGDGCWRDLSCLSYHYETQPIPNPLSRALHFMPESFHVAGVVFNHFTELVVPFCVFGPRVLRRGAGVVLVIFQVFLILSGNLSFLNWLTIVVCLSCFDDGFWRAITPRTLREGWLSLNQHRAEAGQRRKKTRRVVLIALCVFVGIFSINPVINLLSSRQRMNASFDPLHLVNTYGAFGSVGRVRYEVVLEGTSDVVVDEDTEWKAYELPCKPGDPWRRPCIVSPYHYRLDWQMWFLGFRGARGEPWVLSLMHRLLQGEPGVVALFANNPFPEAPPRFLRAQHYRYRFAPANDPSRAWWQRELLGSFVRPVSLEDPELEAFLRRQGWF